VGASEGASFWGTLEYVAPEVVMSGAAAYSPAADWWGLGVLIYELLLGLAPWDADSEEGILEQIKEADVVWPPAGMLTPDTEDLLHGLLTWDPDQRLGAAGPHQLQQHPFFATTHWGSMLPRIQQDQAAQAEATRAQWRQASASGAGSPAGSGSYDSGGSGKGSGSGSSGEGSTARLGGFFSTVGSGGAGGSIIVRGSRRRFAASGSRAASAGAAREGGYSYSRMERSQEEQQRDAPVTHTW
jgi:serine/threonine protein kinase